MPETMTISKVEFANLEERARKLAADKSNLQLTIHLMNKLSVVSGLDNVIEDMLRSVSDVLGGTNQILFYKIDNVLHYADVYGTKKTLAEVDDPRVKTVWETREPAEYAHAFSDTQMITPEFSKAYTWVFPLMVGPDLIGVFKMESLHISMRELSRQLPTFFSYAAHVLKNEILGHTRLKQAYDDLAQEMTVRKQAEEELRLANESLEERVVARTAELQTANEQLRENEKQIKFLLDQSEQSRRALLSILEDEKRVEAALRESEGHIKQLIEASPVAMLVSSGIDEQVVLVNKKFGELFGYTIEDMPDVSHWWSLAYPDEKYREKVRTLWAARAEYAIRNKTQIEPMEAIVTCKDADIRYIEFQLSSIGERHLVVFNDLTARKYAEQALHEREKHSQALLRLSRNLERAQTYEQVLNAARDEVRNIIGYQNLWAYLLTEDKKYAHSLVAGGPTSDTVMSKEGAATLTIQGDRMLEEIAEAKEIVVVEDAQTDERVNKEIVAKMGNRTIVNVPILLFDRHMGAVGTGTFGDEGVRIPTKPEQEFLMALASHMAVALDRIHLLNQRKQTEEALRQSEAGLREAQRLGRLGSWNWDATTDIITWSEEYYHIYGLDPTQRPPGYEEHLKAYTPESAARLDAAVKRNMETGEPYVIDLELVHPDAPSRWITARSETKRNDKGQIVGLRGTAQDITERKQAEDALRASEIRYRRLVELAPYLIAVHFNGNLVFVNEAGAKLFGAATPEQVIGQPVAQFVSPAHRGVSAERIKQGLALGERSPLYEQKVIRLDGTEIDVEVAGVAFPYRDGMAIQIVMQDITERKRAEEALRRLNRELQAISTCNQVLIRAEDEQTLLSDICHIICDEAGYRMAWVGYAENDDAKTVRPVAWAGFEDGYLASANITWADTERGRGPAGTAIRSGESACIKDYTTDPQAAPWRENALQRGYRSCITLPLKDENAKTFGVLNIYSTEPNAFTPDEMRLLDELAGDLAFGIGVLRARTERRRAEEALRESEQKLRTIFSTMEEALSLNELIMDDRGEIVDYKILEVNPAFEKDTELTREQAIGRTATEIYGMSSEYINAFWKAHLHDEHAVKTDMYVDQINTWKHVSTSIPVNGKFVVSYFDITELKNAENALRESEEVYRKLVAASPDAITGTDLAGQITLVSPKAAEMFGHSSDDDVLGRSIFDWVAPEDLEKAAANMQHLLTTGQTRYREFVLRRKDGIYFDGEVNAALIQAADGTPKGAIVITRDITERKRAEQKANQLAAIVQSSEDAIIGKTLDGIITSWNRGAEKIYGYAESEVIGKPIAILVLPGREDEVPQILEKIKAGEHIEHYETVRRRKDGRDIQMSLTISPVRDAEGKIVAVSTIGRDITERKRAEQERLAHLRFFESMDQINRAMQGTNDLEQMMSDVLDVVLSIFDCDRAWLVYPCDPDAASFRVPMEITKPEYPGAKILNVDVPMSPGEAQNMREALESDAPVTFTAGTERPIATAKQFGVQSQMFVPVYPKLGKPWVFGMHQCAYPRIWTAEEKRFFQEIGRRLSDSLSSLLMYRNLRESEERFATAFHLSPIAISIVRATDGRFVDVNDVFVKTSGYTREEIIGRTSNELQLWAQPEKQAPRMRQLQEQGSTGTFEFTVRTKTGENRIGLSATAQIDLGGEKHYLSLIHDITDRKRAEEALRANEARFRALVENSSEIITILNADSTVRYESPAHERVLGYTLEEMIGAYPLALVHPEDLPRLVDLFVKGIQVPKYTAYAEYRMRHKDGSWRTMEMVACNLLEDPAVEGIVVNSRDITERMHAEAELAKYREHLEELVTERTQQLRESEQHYRQLFETMLQGVVYQDANGKIISMNPAAEHILGVTPSELLGTTSMENESAAFREDGSLLSRSEHPATVTQLTGEEVHNVVVGIYNPRVQSYRWINISAVPVFRAGEDKPYQVYTLFDDVTERKRAEEQIRKLNQDLQERAVALEAANKELEAFAYSVSHDLRAPLRHIDGFLELFQTKMASQFDEQSQHYLENISDAAKRMGTLIDDLLSFSRMGRYEMSKLRVDLGALTQEVIREFEPESRGRNIHWQIADLPVVTGDRAMLRIVLVNLISNALKFTQPREQTEIEIGWLREEETGTVIFMRDNGVGFDMNYADKLFGVFQRLHRADEFEGTGIGLANVRRIISRHGGRTWAKGEVNQGATFYFSLPQTTQGG